MPSEVLVACRWVCLRNPSFKLPWGYIKGKKIDKNLVKQIQENAPRTDSLVNSTLSFSTVRQDCGITRILNAHMRRDSGRFSKGYRLFNALAFKNNTSNIVQNAKKAGKVNRLFSLLRKNPKFVLSSFFGAVILPSPEFKPKKEENYRVDINISAASKPKEKKHSWVSKQLLILYEILRVGLRGVRLFFTFGPILALYPITCIGPAACDLWWKMLLLSMEFSGPVWIKFGQWASTRYDIFPDSCCRQFSRLQRQSAPHSWNFTKYRLYEAFGPMWEDIFVKFDNNQEPIGSGCVAQVYKAWMKADKIQDETVKQEIISDLEDDDHNSMLFEYGMEVFGLNRMLPWLKRFRKIGKDEQNEPIGAEKVDVTKQQGVTQMQDMTRKGLEATETVDDFLMHSDEDSEGNGTDHFSLSEEWQDAQNILDKSLPVVESEEERVEGLLPVAIKVLHPGMQGLLRRDLVLMKVVAKVLTFVIPSLQWLSLPECVEEFSHFLSAQTDLLNEAKNLDIFSTYFEDVQTVKFPKPLRPYVTSKVLVETFEEGECLANFVCELENDRPEELKVNLAKIGMEALLKMIFEDNFVHGDLHPGNILVQNNSAEDGEDDSSNDGNQNKITMVDIGCDTFVMNVQPDPRPLRICILDCGVVATVQENDLANFRAVFRQVVLGNGESVADLFLSKSHHECSDPETFRAEMSDLVASARTNTTSLGKIDVGILLMQVLRILQKHKIRLDSSFSTIVMSVFVLEGLGRSLDGNMNILEQARSVLFTG